MTLEDIVHECFSNVIERDNGECYVCCPFCEERGETRDSRNRLGINYESGTWNCFNCGHRGKESPEWLFRELVRIFDLDRSEHMFSWRSTLQKKEHKKKKLHIVSLPKEFEPLWEKSKDKLHKRALAYILARGVTEQQIEDHFIGFCVVGDYAGRIVFPVYRKEQVIGFVARAFEKDIEPKYLNSDGLKYIWNTPEEKTVKGILLEGIFDALASERVLPDVYPMAGLGHSLTEEQLKPLLKFHDFTLVPDPDRVGIVGTIKRARLLLEMKEHLKLHVVMPKEDEVRDWGKLGEKKETAHKIVNAYEGRVLWSKFIESKLRMFAASI